MDYKTLLEQRKEIFEQDDTDTYRHVGYFLVWFGQAEISLTLLLALLSRSDDLTAFEIISKGLDARLKIERLRKLAKTRAPIKQGSNLDIRLDYFHKTIVGLRNKLSHNGFYHTKGPKGTVLHLTSLTRFPPTLKHPLADATEPAYQISLVDLFKRGRWTHLFCDELKPLWKRYKLGEEIEITNPLSWVPTEFPDGPH